MKLKMMNRGKQHVLIFIILTENDNLLVIEIVAGLFSVELQQKLNNYSITV